MTTHDFLAFAAAPCGATIRTPARMPMAPKMAVDAPTDT
jgi:hypothetical protein